MTNCDITQRSISSKAFWIQKYLKGIRVRYFGRDRESQGQEGGLGPALSLFPLNIPQCFALYSPCSKTLSKRENSHVAQCVRLVFDYLPLSSPRFLRKAHRPMFRRATTPRCSGVALDRIAAVAYLRFQE